jgi:hypothetical protein
MALLKLTNTDNTPLVIDVEKLMGIQCNETEAEQGWFVFTSSKPDANLGSTSGCATFIIDTSNSGSAPVFANEINEALTASPNGPIVTCRTTSKLTSFTYS